MAGRDELILDLPEPVWIDLEAAAAEVERARQALEREDVRRAPGRSPRCRSTSPAADSCPARRRTGSRRPRRELEEVHLHSLEVIGRAGLAMGGTQLQSAERAARTLIESEPYRESGYVLLMEALAARGNVAEAMRVFDALRTLLRDELGTSPSPEALAAHERLLRPQAHGAGGARSPQRAGPGRRSRCPRICAHRAAGPR